MKIYLLGFLWSRRFLILSMFALSLLSSIAMFVGIKEIGVNNHSYVISYPLSQLSDSDKKYLRDHNLVNDLYENLVKTIHDKIPRFQLNYKNLHTSEGKDHISFEAILPKKVDLGSLQMAKEIVKPENRDVENLIAQSEIYFLQGHYSTSSVKISEFCESNTAICLANFYRKNKLSNDDVKQVLNGISHEQIMLQELDKASLDKFNAFLDVLYRSKSKPPTSDKFCKLIKNFANKLVILHKTSTSEEVRKVTLTPGITSVAKRSYIPALFREAMNPLILIYFPFALLMIGILILIVQVVCSHSLRLYASQDSLKS